MNISKISKSNINNYSIVSFKRSVEEHKSWGANFNPESQDVSFKIFAYPDADKVSLTVFKTDNPKNGHVYDLVHDGNGVYKTIYPLSPIEAKPGDKYYFTVSRNGSLYYVKDPYSFEQDEIFGPSTIYNQSEYKWHDDDWFKNNKNRISRIANENNSLSPVKSARIYEMHIGTSSSESTFEGAKKQLKRIKNLGFNAVELMPAEGTNSFNWGYDGVDKFAPSKFLGGPDGLKSFVDYAHNIGLNVIMDMVPNHIGPEGNQLRKTGPYISSNKNTPFGDKFNYEENDSRYVRDYMVNAALNWLDNYHCDGLRLDLTSDMGSDMTMKQIAAEVNYHKPDAFLIAEDGRVFDTRITKPLNDLEFGIQSPQDHINAIEDISKNKPFISLKNLGYDARWDFGYYHTLRGCLSKGAKLSDLANCLYSTEYKIKYLMSHDEIGNHEGTRLMSKLMAEELKLFDKVILNDDDIKRISALRKMGKNYDNALNAVRGQKIELSAEKLLDLIVNTDKNYIRPEFIKSKTDLENVEYDDALRAYKNAFDKSKLGIANVYSAPGPKMVFQGDESLNQTPFRFFRKFKKEYPETWLHDEKGYDTGYEAFELSNLELNSKRCSLSDYYEALVHDLNELNIKNETFIDGRYDRGDTVIHPISFVLATHLVHNKNPHSIFTVSNFDDKSYCEYYIKIPQGKWREIINTDNPKYGGSGAFLNENVIESTGGIVKIKLPKYSTVIFEKVSSC